jgi:Fe-S oxidoreductase
MDPPRYILENIPGVELKAIAKEKTQSTCCGGGGAQIWYEMPGSEINAYRLEQLAEHSPDKVAVACPYCNIMLSSANTTGIAKAPDIEDVAVILSRSVFRKVESQPATSAS